MSIVNDHRLLAEEMELFFIDAEIGAGLPVWLPNGVAIRDALESFVKNLERQDGYQRVVSPHVAKESLYKKSGHLQHYKAEMFPEMKWPENREKYFLRPMNCPHHHKVFANSPRSFRQLPFRIAEYGQVYRFEPSGSLRGLARVRGLCQNDAHIYVAPEQAFLELVQVLKLHERCYKALGLQDYRYRLSKHGSEANPEFEGARMEWLECEQILRQALDALKLPYFEADGEAAFYGPKIDVQMKLGGNEESVASVQLDCVSGERFDLSFVDSSQQQRIPWIIHRAPLGSHERFVAMLLEVYQGRLPGWLAPIQAVVLPANEKALAAAHDVWSQLLASGLRAELVGGPGHVSKRIRHAHRLRPFSKIVIGEKEVESGVVKLQLRESQLEVAFLDLANVLSKEVAVPG